MTLESLEKEVEIFSGEDVFTGKLISLQPDSLVYEDEEGKHLLPVSRFSLIIHDTKDTTSRIEKDKKKIFIKYLLINGALFLIGLLFIILLRVR